MNKIKYLLFTLFLSALMIPSVFAKGTVEIKSIELDSKSENATVKSEPEFDGLKMDFDIAFKEENDFVKYKVVLKNDTDIDYKISDDTSFNTSKYVSYKYEVGSELKSGSQTDVYVTMTYNKKVAASDLVNNKYTESNRAVVQLKNKIENPKTGVENYTIILVSLAALAIITLIVLNKKKSLNYTSFAIILGIILVPTVIKGAELLKLTMDVKIEIEEGYEVGYYVNSPVLFTDAEKDNYTIINSDACVVVYTETTKYNYCEDAIKKDNKLYAEGETTPLKEITISAFKFPGSLRAKEYKSSNDTVDNKQLLDGIDPQVESTEPGITFSPLLSIDYCTLRDDMTYVCPDQYVVERTLNTWLYNSMALSEKYTTLETDKDVMNFTEITYDDWNLNRVFTVGAPQNFKMPAHNVLFRYGDLFQTVLK